MAQARAIPGNWLPFDAGRAGSTWIRPAAKTLQAGPVYLVALSSDAIARDGDALDSAGFCLHRVVIAVAPDYHGAVAIHGHRLGTPGPRAQDSSSPATVLAPALSSRPM